MTIEQTISLIVAAASLLCLLAVIADESRP
jgi:hypothetical protein